MSAASGMPSTSSTAVSSTPFAARAIVVIVVLVAAGLAAFLLLSAYGDELRPSGNGGGHALSNSAVGFSGAVILSRDAGSPVTMVRDERSLDTPGLLILTPTFQTSPERIAAILKRRQMLPTLIVLPKWQVRPIAAKPAWVENVGKASTGFSAMPLGTIVSGLSLRDRGGWRTIEGKGIGTLVEAPGGGNLLASIVDTPHMILADPDAIDNLGLKTVQGVKLAMDVLDTAEWNDESIAFDLTLVGLGRKPNLLKLGFEPPFLALTLCLLLAAGLAVLHALRRFGPPARDVRALAFGKRALAENGAALLRLARRRHRTGGRYVQLTREAVLRATGAPPGLSGSAADRYLDRLHPEGERFTSIAARAEDAPDTRRLLAAVRDLYFWRRTVTRDHR